MDQGTCRQADRRKSPLAETGQLRLRRLQRFEEDFRRLVSWLGIGAQLIVQDTCNESGLDGVSPHGYRHAQRMNRRSIAKINALFADDFDLLGYPKLQG